MNKAILTKRVCEELLKSQNIGHTECFVSLDLEKSKEQVKLTKETVLIHDQNVPLSELKRAKEGTIYVVEENKLFSVELFGEDTNLYYKLKPTSNWPTLMLSSVPMHRFITTTPKEDTQSKIDSINPIVGHCLDTCCGLGYTAIMMANKGAEKVDCFEKDKNVIQILNYNPYSEEIFTNKKISLHEESILEGIKKFDEKSFDRIIHDPPTVSFAKELYSTEFYKQLFRVLKPNGKLYHYTPNPGKTKGKEFHLAVMKRLKEIGFSKVIYLKNSSGVSAIRE